MPAFAWASRWRTTWSRRASDRTSAWWWSARPPISAAASGRGRRRTYRPQLHQPSLADLWRHLRLGIREERARTQRARRWPARVQRRGLHVNAALNGLGLAYLPDDLVQPTSPKGTLSKPSPTGARRSPATISITRAVTIAHRRLPFWSMRCAIVDERPTLPLVVPDKRPVRRSSKSQGGSNHLATERNAKFPGRPREAGTHTPRPRS